MGPFRPKEDLTLTLNQYSWSSISNMVFIEAPCGVGYSYSDNNETDYVTGDEQTASDNYELIQGFLDRFPEYRQNDLYISSESYGGHYMPTLAKKIVTKNAANADTSRVLNFKGFAVGNPYTNPYTGIMAMMDTFWGHQLVSLPSWEEYNSNCSGVPYAELVDDDVPESLEVFRDCFGAVIQLLEEVGSLNPYGEWRILLYSHLHSISQPIYPCSA
jgi:carboxypeptidase C (cathepsin A)